MSRSYKKQPISKDHDTGKWGKKQANKAVRKIKDDFLRGSNYKKVYCSWNIHDYIAYYSRKEAIKDWYDEEANHYQGRQPLHKRYGTLERWLKAWEKMMLRK